jgi:hypothetical protein
VFIKNKFYKSEHSKWDIETYEYTG